MATSTAAESKQPIRPRTVSSPDDFLLFPHQDVYCVPADRVTPGPTACRHPGPCSPPAWNGDQCGLGRAARPRRSDCRHRRRRHRPALGVAVPPDSRRRGDGAGSESSPGEAATALGLRSARRRRPGLGRPDHPRQRESEGRWTALALADVDARIVEVSWYGAATGLSAAGRSLPLAPPDHRSSQVGPHPAPGGALDVCATNDGGSGAAARPAARCV